ncbi:MAG: hypothetical protein ACLFPU_05795 [Dehalococcoidia bacterium]
MAKISGIDEKWHESLQILLVLKTTGPLNRKDLCEKVVENQKKIISDYTRSKSTCIYWINSHLKDGKIREVDSLLELTQLGRWIVESKTRSMEDREWFIERNTCWKCRPSSIVLYNLEEGTMETNKNGHVFMDVECPRCGDFIKRHRLTAKIGKTDEGIGAEDFFRFYNRVKDELLQRGILS